MATYTSDVQSWDRYRWIVPTPTNVAEIGKAVAVAKRQAEEIQIDTDSDDWLTITPTGDAVVLWFDVRTGSA
jgi:hypothetical protein